ncbi:serine palmitoyltransferase [Lactarius sanguifluus]|nr:serine palmitoyltransferase [Lactarius sanguifluus]
MAKVRMQFQRTIPVAQYSTSSWPISPFAPSFSPIRPNSTLCMFSEKEVDELVDELTPEPLGSPLTSEEQSDFTSVPMVSGANGPRPKLTNTGQAGLRIAGNNTIKVRAIETPRRYGVGICGPPGFYGTIDVHMDPAFTKPGDIIVPNRGINFRYYHKERRKRCGPLTRRFVVTEDILAKDGVMPVVDLPKLIELKHTSASIVSFSLKASPLAQRDEPDAGLTELYMSPYAYLLFRFVVCWHSTAKATQISMIVGLVANGPNLSGGFCAGSHIVMDHPRINGTSFVFSVAVPALLMVSASEGINTLRNMPSVLAAAGERARDVGRSRSGRGHHDPLACLLVDHRYPPAFCGDAICTHIRVCEAAEPCDPRSTLRARSACCRTSLTRHSRMVCGSRARGVFAGRNSSKRARASASPSRLLSRKESERAASVIWAAVTKVLAKRK